MIGSIVGRAGEVSHVQVDVVGVKIRVAGALLVTIPTVACHGDECNDEQAVESNDM